MDIDWGTVWETGADDVTYIREHLLRSALTGALFVGIGLFVTGGWGVALLTLGVLHRFFSWVAAARAANGDEAKIQEARKEFVRFLETLLLAGLLRALRMGRSGSSEERLPDVVRQPRRTNVVPTVTAGETLTKALDNPGSARVIDSNRNPLVPSSGGGIQTVDPVMSAPGPLDGFVTVSRNLDSAVKSLTGLSPAGRWALLQQAVQHELDALYVPSVRFHEGKYSRLIVKTWTIEFPSEWMKGPISGENIIGQLASRINEAVEYWAVALHCGGSPTLKRVVLREFPGPLVREAERRQRIGPMPINDPDRVSNLIAALPAHLDWPVVREKLAQARRDFAEPTANPMISDLEGGILLGLQLEADVVKRQMIGYASALGSKRAARWARQQYRGQTDNQPAPAPPQSRALRHDNFEFNGQFFQRMQLAQADWAYPDVDVKQRCYWLTESLNEQLSPWGLPRWKVVPGQGTAIDVEKRELVISDILLRPEMAAQFETIYAVLAYQAVKIVQDWKIYKYRLETESPALTQLPEVIEAMARKQLPMPPDEFRRAQQLHESEDSRFLILHQLHKSYNALMNKQLAVHDALAVADEDSPTVDAALTEYQDAVADHEQYSDAFSQRPEEDEAIETVDRTIGVFRALSKRRLLGGR